MRTHVRDGRAGTPKKPTGARAPQSPSAAMPRFVRGEITLMSVNPWSAGVPKENPGLPGVPKENPGLPGVPKGNPGLRVSQRHQIAGRNLLSCTQVHARCPPLSCSYVRPTTGLPRMPTHAARWRCSPERQLMLRFATTTYLLRSRALRYGIVLTRRCSLLHAALGMSLRTPPSALDSSVLVTNSACSVGPGAHP